MLTVLVLALATLPLLVACYDLRSGFTTSPKGDAPASALSPDEAALERGLLIALQAAA